MSNLSSVENTATKALPEKNGLRYDIDVTHSETSQEDQEVLEIVRQGEQVTIDTQPRVIVSTIGCDSLRICTLKHVIIMVSLFHTC